jgi:hypothetical protein
MDYKEGNWFEIISKQARVSVDFYTLKFVK